MAKKVKTGSVEIPESAFLDENMTAHISLRIPMLLLNDLRRLSLSERHRGRYQSLMKEILQDYVDSAKSPSIEKARIVSAARISARSSPKGLKISKEKFLAKKRA